MMEIEQTTGLDTRRFDPREGWRFARTCGGYRRWHAIERGGEPFWRLESDWGQAHLVGLVAPASAFELAIRIDYSEASRGGFTVFLCESLRVGRATLEGGGDNGLPFFIEAWAALGIPADGALSLGGRGVESTATWVPPAGAFSAPTTVTFRYDGIEGAVRVGDVALGTAPMPRAPSAPLLVVVGGGSPEDPPSIAFGEIAIRDLRP